jgi:hypothetical protein
MKPSEESPASKSTNTRKRQQGNRISAACEACKKRKTKCSGGPSPCQLCESLGTDCVIDLSLDMRRRAALQRTLDESKTFQDTLDGLIDCIREGPSTTLDSLFEAIRTGSSNHNVTDAIRQYLGSRYDGRLFSSQPTYTNSPRGHEVKQEEGVWSGSEYTFTAFDRASKNSERPAEIRSLVGQLKSLTVEDGEQLLRRYLDKQGVSGSSPYSGSPVEAPEQSTTWPTAAARSRWHPALHIQSNSGHSDGLSQVCSESRSRALCFSTDR